MNGNGVKSWGSSGAIRVILDEWYESLAVSWDIGRVRWKEGKDVGRGL